MLDKEKWPKRYVVGLFPDDEANPGTVEYDLELIRYALTLAAECAAKRGTDVTLLYDSVKHLDSDASVSRFFDQKLINKLKKGESIRLGDVATMHLMVPGTQKSRLSSVVVSINPTNGVLDHLHGAKTPREEFVVPWFRSEVNQWGDIYGFTRIVDKEVTLVAPLEIESESVRNAIDDIINHYAGLGHKSDKAAVRKQLAKLRARRVVLDARSIRAHILRESFWQPTAADELVSIAMGRGIAANI